MWINDKCRVIDLHKRSTQHTRHRKVEEDTLHIHFIIRVENGDPIMERETVKQKGKDLVMRKYNSYFHK